MDASLAAPPFLLLSPPGGVRTGPLMAARRSDGSPRPGLGVPQPQPAELGLLTKQICFLEGKRILCKFEKRSHEQVSGREGMMLRL